MKYVCVCQNCAAKAFFDNYTEARFWVCCGKSVEIYVNGHIYHFAVQYSK